MQLNRLQSKQSKDLECNKSGYTALEPGSKSVKQVHAYTTTKHTVWDEAPSKCNSCKNKSTPASSEASQWQYFDQKAKLYRFHAVESRNEMADCQWRTAQALSGCQECCNLTQWPNQVGKLPPTTIAIARCASKMLCLNVECNFHLQRCLGDLTSSRMAILTN